MKLKTSFFLPVLVALLTVVGPWTSTASALIVDMELSLLVDVSSSINATEFGLQRTGYANAFQDAGIVNSIVTGGSAHAIAVNLVYWASTGSQLQSVGWTLINDSTTANSFAAAVLAAARPFSGTTAPGSAINFDVPLFNNNGFEGTKLVIDISSDGQQNSGASTTAARNAAQALGFTINALAIGNTALLQWYTDNAITSDGFALQANDFNAFGSAIKEKIAREIGEPPPHTNGVIPEPTSLGLFGTGLIGYLMRRRQKVA